jgi:hypothetical protein
LPRLRTPLAVSGLQPEALAFLEPWLDQFGFVLTPGGFLPAESGADASSHTGDREPISPGAAVAVELMRGDANLAAIGTLTAIDGDQVLAFGHPFLFSGSSHLPLSRAEIVGIVPRTQSSFKLGVASQPIGAITEDRRAGVAGRLGETPYMLPLDLRLRVPGSGWESYRYEIARHRFMAPLLVTIAAASGVTSHGSIPPESAWRWQMTVRYRSAGEGEQVLELADFASGTTLFPLFTAVGQPVGALLNNPWSAVEIDAVELTVDLTDRLEVAGVAAVRLNRAVVRPGETVQIEVDLQPFRGPLETIRLSYPVPENLSRGRLRLFVGGGADLNRLERQRQPGLLRPGSLEELIAQLESRPKTSTLYVTAYAAAREMRLRGRDYPELPGSAQMILGSRTQADATTSWSNMTPLERISYRLDRALMGGTLLSVEVSPAIPEIDAKGNR